MSARATLAGLGLLVAAAIPPAIAEAECQGGSCREPSSATALEPSTALSPGARETVRFLDAWAGRRAMALRYGPRHPEMIARDAALASLAADLDAARAAGATIARDEVLGWLRAALSDVEGRLAELGTRCGPQHLDLRGAEARRDALREALTTLEALAPARTAELVERLVRAPG